MKTLLCFLTVAVFTSAFIADKVTLKADKTQSSISYTCVHSLHEWTGVNKNIDCAMIYVDATNTIEKVAMLGRVVNFDSENTSRDSHALEVLEALQYPNVTFSSTSITATDTHLKVTGNLIFHNVTKLISFDAVREDKDKQISVKGNFSILLSDYNIDRPSFMLMKTEDKMDLSFVMVFHK